MYLTILQLFISENAQNVERLIESTPPCAGRRVVMLFGFVSFCALAAFVHTVNGATVNTLSSRFGQMHRVQWEETRRVASLKRSPKLFYSCCFTMRVTQVMQQARLPACWNRHHRRVYCRRPKIKQCRILNFKRSFELDGSGGGASGLEKQQHRKSQLKDISQSKCRIYHSLQSQNTEILKMPLLCTHVGPAAVMWQCNTWRRTSAFDRFRFPLSGWVRAWSRLTLHSPSTLMQEYIY